MEEGIRLIKTVAIYLRKSRDDGQNGDVLSKHRDTLTSFAKTKGWRYELYEEIESAETLSRRPVMLQILEDVKSGAYDGILVMDIDRLGRGNHLAEIQNTLYEENTLVITPQKIYDLANDADDMMFGFQSLFAKCEYKMIKKRLQEGKRAGVRKGMWTNGKPPFPYVYNRLTKKVEVDPDKEEIYRAIIDEFLNGLSTLELMIWLNKRNIPSPSGSNWHTQSVRRVLIDEVHLGYVIANKVKGSGHKAKGGKQIILSLDKQTKVKGIHLALKTEEEHAKILAKLAMNRKIPPKSRAGLLPLSGLLYCSKCGHRMSFKQGQVQRKTGKMYYSAICVYTYPDGAKCGQKGRKLDEEFYNLVFDEVIKLDETTISKDWYENQEYAINKKMVDMKKNELEKHIKALNIVMDGYEEGTYTKQVFMERKQNRENMIVQVRNEIQELETIINLQYSKVTETDLLNGIRLIKGKWQETLDAHEQNQLLRTVIDRIVYDRHDDRIQLDVVYK